MSSPLEEIANFRLVDDRLITAGQPTEDQLRAVADAGFEVVINLAPQEDPRSLADEAGLARSLGMAYINIPVPFAAPTRGQLDEFFEAMDANPGKRLLVHCLANKRVTAFLGLYWARGGQPLESAFALMRGVWTPNEVWAKFIDEHLKLGP